MILGASGALVLLGWAPSAALAAAVTAAPAPLPTAGYTATQAEAGAATYGTFCAVCHDPVEGRPFTGDAFRERWFALPVGQLFRFVSTAMPQDAPGSLSADRYAALVAYMLRLNGVPAGEAALPSDAQMLDGLAFPALP